jgi:hypothetical protein
MNIKPVGHIIEEENLSRCQNEGISRVIDVTLHLQIKFAGVKQVILQSLMTVKIPLISSFTVAFFGMMTGEDAIDGKEREIGNVQTLFKVMGSLTRRPVFPHDLVER